MSYCSPCILILSEIRILIQPNFFTQFSESVIGTFPRCACKRFVLHYPRSSRSDHWFSTYSVLNPYSTVQKCWRVCHFLCTYSTLIYTFERTSGLSALTLREVSWSGEKCTCSVHFIILGPLRKWTTSPEGMVRTFTHEEPSSFGTLGSQFSLSWQPIRNFVFVSLLIHGLVITS